MHAIFQWFVVLVLRNDLNSFHLSLLLEFQNIFTRSVHMYQEINVSELGGRSFGTQFMEKIPLNRIVCIHAVKILEFFTRKNWTDTCNSGHITKWFTSFVRIQTFGVAHMPLCTKPCSFRKVFRLRTHVNCVKGSEKKIIKLYLPIITCLPFTLFRRRRFPFHFERQLHEG